MIVGKSELRVSAQPNNLDDAPTKVTDFLS